MVRLEACTFRNNQAEIGGALAMEDVHLEIHNCSFVENVARIRGGGISIAGSRSSLTMEQCQFVRNRVVQPLPSTLPFYGDPNGSPLETSPYWRFRFPSSSGGAVFVNTISNTRIENCEFEANLAQAGGAVSLLVDIYTPNRDRRQEYTLRVLDSSFVSNRADYTEEYKRNAISGSLNDDFRLGGGLYIASSSDRFTLRLRRCNLTENWAMFGGALHLVTHSQTQPSIERCHFHANKAQEAGGGMFIRNCGSLHLDETNQTMNEALLGGAMMLTNNAQMLLLGLSGLEACQGIASLFEGNRAASGGGIMCSGCGYLVLQDAVFRNNTASERGGGFFALDSNTGISFTQGHFENNQARAGGAIAAEVTANLIISTASAALSTVFRNNRANSGAALYVKANHQRENRLFIRRANFTSNIAQSAEEPMECGNGAGGGLCFILDQIPVGAVADFLLEESTFARNQAAIGGGAYVRVKDISWMDGADSRSRCPTAIPTDAPCRSFRFGNITMTENKAHSGAGGFFINDPESLALFCPTIPPFRRRSLLEVTEKNMGNLSEANFVEDLFCTRISGNHLVAGEFGPDLGTAVYSLFVSDPVAPIRNHTGGERLLPPCSDDHGTDCAANRTTGLQVSVLDAFGQRISGGIPDAELAVVLISDSIIGEQRYTAESGIINVNNTAGIGINSTSNLLIQSIQNRSLETALDFWTRACLPGENSTIFSCQVCLPNQYSFDAEIGCRDCEDRGICLGRAALVPLDGYWHSTPFSPQFHECIVRKACEYDDRVNLLTSFYSNLEEVDAQLRLMDDFVDGRDVLMDYSSYEQCATGYKGVLCGSCQAGYGHVLGGECVECPIGRTGSLLFAVLVSIWATIFLGINIFTTLSSTQRHIQMALYQKKDQNPTSLEMQNLRQHGVRAGPPPLTPAASSTAPTLVERQNQDRIVAMVKMTETLKISINYLQVTSVALSINLNWQKIIKSLLSIQSLVIGVTSGSYLVPLDCSFDKGKSELDEGVPNSIKVLWIQIAFPAILLLFYSMLCILYFIYLRRNQALKDFASFSSYLTVIIIVVIFFSYIKVTSELMSTVNCISVDTDDEEHVYSHYAILARKRFWAEDTELQCFEGDHTLTGIFGVLGLIFFSTMVILFILIWLPYNANRLDEPEFIARYGFIYQGYKEQWYFSFWEAIITIRKALIAAAVVFAFPLGPNLQGVCALGVIILAISIHFIFSPFKTFAGHPNVPPYAADWLSWFCLERMAERWIRLNNAISLNALESGSLLMSIIIFYSGILFNDEKTSQGGKVTMAIFAFALNVGFILYLLYRLYNGAHVAANISCEQLQKINPNALIPSGNGVLPFLQKVVLLVRNRNLLDNHGRTIAYRDQYEEHV